VAFLEKARLIFRKNEQVKDSQACSNPQRRKTRRQIAALLMSDKVFREEEKIDERDHTEALHKTRHARHGVACGRDSRGGLVRHWKE
jgi:hypothetical protein